MYQSTGPDDAMFKIEWLLKLETEKTVLRVDDLILQLSIIVLAAAFSVIAATGNLSFVWFVAYALGLAIVVLIKLWRARTQLKTIAIIRELVTEPSEQGEPAEVLR